MNFFSIRHFPIREWKMTDDDDEKSECGGECDVGDTLWISFNLVPVVMYSVFIICILIHDFIKIQL